MLYRKKPIVIEAHQWWPQAAPTPETEDTPGRPRKAELYGVRYCPPTRVDDTRRGIKFDRAAQYVIDTLEGPMQVQPGDWIVVGIKGERYAVKPDIFALTYETVGAAQLKKLGWFFNRWRRR